MFDSSRRCQSGRWSSSAWWVVPCRMVVVVAAAAVAAAAIESAAAAGLTAASPQCPLPRGAGHIPSGKRK